MGEGIVAAAITTTIQGDGTPIVVAAVVAAAAVSVRTVILNQSSGQKNATSKNDLVLSD